MTGKRYTITLGKNNEFKEIIDHSKQDKHISMFEFLKQVNEQDKAFKELKAENEELKSKYSEQCVQLDFLKDENQHMRDLVNENKQLKQELQLLKAEKTYETITLREQVPNEIIDKFKKDLKDGKFIELTARPQIRKHKNDHISWKGDVE